MPLRHLIMTVCLMAGLTLQAQYAPFANYTNWKQVQSEHFDVLYKGSDANAASRVARYAEQARYELGILFDYKPEQRYTLVYFNDANEVLQSNFSLEADVENPGVLNFEDPIGKIIYHGDLNQLYAETRRETARLIMQEFAHGKRLGNIVQSAILQHNPRWYWEGLLEYVSTGWTYEDEMWITSVRNDDLLDMALEGDEYINRIVRKSIWHYITREYGEPKISEIVYLVNIARSVESGIISVLGISLPTLTERWREYIKVRYGNQVSQRTAWENLSGLQKIEIPNRYNLLAAAPNPKGDNVALYLERDGLQSVWLYDLETLVLTEGPIVSGLKRSDARFTEFEPVLSWHPNGRQIVASSFLDKTLALAYWRTDEKDVSYKELSKNVQKIVDLQWSNDGRKIAVSALRESRVDLFLTNAGDANLSALTNDSFDDLDPSWSLDGAYLYFSSNRDSTLMQDQSGAWAAHANDFDLFRYDLEEDTIIRISRTPLANERQSFPISGFEIGYISDETGIHNIHQANIFTGEQQVLSNLALGISKLQIANGEVLLSSAEHGELTASLVPFSSFQAGIAPQPTLLRVEDLAAYQEKQLKESRLQALVQPSVELTNPSVPQAEPKEEKKEDNRPARYYIFDEEEEPYEAKRPTEPSRQRQERRPKLPPPTVFGNEPKPEIADVEVENLGTASRAWQADYLGLNWNFDPVAQYGFEFSAGFSDILDNHKFGVSVAPYIISGTGIDSDISYSYNKNRLDLFAEAGYVSRQLRRENNLESDSFIFRFDQLRINAGARYPISTNLSVEGSLGGYYIDRKDQQFLRQDPLDDQDAIVRAGAGIRFNNVRETEGYPYQGWKAEAFFDSYYSTSENAFAFSRVQAEVKNYTSFYRNFVLATRFAGGFNIPNEQVQYYLGGTNERFLPPIAFQREALAGRSNTIDTSLHSFHFQNFLMPLRGFRPNSREGTRYIMGSVELRMPLSRMAKSALNSKNLYNLELIPFLDVGTVWVDGNPFSDKNPTDTQILTNGPITVKLQTLKSPFLLGFGAGLRANVIGYSMRFDLAWGLDDGTLRAPMLMTSVGKNF